MKDLIDNVIGFIVAVILLTSVILSIRHNLKEEEYIEQLEQSLAEQIQEKQVYINILERKENEKEFKNIY